MAESTKHPVVLSFEQSVTEWINENHLFRPTDPVLIGCSGGPDSMALLQFMVRNHKGKIHVAHVNYHLRVPDADLDQELVQSFCESRNLPCFVKHEPLQLAQSHLQEEARKTRYEFFQTLLATHQIPFLLTAHHADDVMETSLMFFLRGSGSRGIRGIQAAHQSIRRPLLSQRREKILSYVKATNTSFRIDRSNLKNDYTRNTIRNQILPFIIDLVPSAEKGILHSAERISRDSDALMRFSLSFFRANVRQSDHYLALPVNPITKYPPCLYYILQAELNINEMGQLLSALPTGAIIEKERFIVQSDRNQILLFPHIPDFTAIRIPTAQHTATMWGELSLMSTSKPVFTADPMEEYIDADSLQFPLCLRTIEEGDHFQPYGMKGSRRKISDYLTDDKIPLTQKKRTLVLENGDGRVIWLVGHRVAEWAKIKEDTTSYMLLSFTASFPQFVSQLLKDFTM